MRTRRNNYPKLIENKLRLINKYHHAFGVTPTAAYSSATQLSIYGSIYTAWDAAGRKITSGTGPRVDAELSTLADGLYKAHCAM